MFLEKLEVRALLGKGGHAWVYDCFDCFLERPVAVKAIKTLREAGRDLRRRAQAEAQVLANLAHPNLVRVIDAGVVGGLVYIVMEKLEGRTLRDTLMEVSRLSVRDALGIAIQIADGMQVAHSTGVIHRDLKPENIFIAPGNQVKVLDFGVAKVLGASHATTQKDRLQGTVLYMSPEQLQGVAVTPASDVFALGTMLFEMLYGHPLTLGGELPNNEHVAWMQLYKVPPPLESLDRKIPRYVGKLVGRAIVKLPSDRYQTMREFHDAAVAALGRYDAECAATAQPAARPEPSPSAHAALGIAKHAVMERAAPRARTIEPQETASPQARSPKLAKSVTCGLLAGLMVIAALIALLHVPSPIGSTAVPTTIPGAARLEPRVTRQASRPPSPPTQAGPAAPRFAGPMPAPSSLPLAVTAPVRRHRRAPAGVDAGIPTEPSSARMVAKRAAARTHESIF